MKLSGIFAGLNFGSEIAATEVSEPFKSLNRLTGFSTEILQSDAFDHKSDKWRKKWIIHFQNNANRMERSMSRKCGFYDADIHIFDYEYDTEDACNGMKMIIDGFSTWSENHLSQCNGQKNRSHHQKRMVKWGQIFAKVLDCDSKASSYTFVVPEDHWYMDNWNGPDFEVGDSLEFSDSCNPDFEDSDEEGCEIYGNKTYCAQSASFFFEYAVVNEHGIWETGLQCPQCGCDANGAANLNDVYADKGRKLSIKKN